jgi:Putative prokaryotic signal transducing protein
MRELLITNDPVLLSYVEALLADQGIEAVVFDRHISVMEGGIGAFPRRLLVGAVDWRRAADILTDAGLGQWLAADDGA